MQDLTQKDNSLADLVISTVHKAKGYGFPRVRLAEDFYDFFTDDGKPDARMHSEETREERNLMYVGLTRVMDTIWPNKALRKIIRFGAAYLRQRQAELEAIRATGQPVMVAFVSPPVEGFHLRNVGQNLMLYSNNNAPGDWTVLDRATGGQESLGYLISARADARMGGRELTSDEGADLAAIYTVLTSDCPRTFVQVSNPPVLLPSVVEPIYLQPESEAPCDVAEGALQVA